MDIKDFQSTSQHNEDGLLLWAFGIIPDCGKYCVEFGAWDGKHLSNTYNLIANHGWSGLLIEGDKERALALKTSYPFKDRIIAVNKFVGWSSDDSLDSILSHYNISDTFDLLSIDVDGTDYHVWKALTRYKPRVVVIEFNSEIPNDIEFIQEANSKVVQGTSLKSMKVLAGEKGYELIAVTPTNAFFVDSIYFHLFKLKDNSLDAINPQKAFPRVFQLYDGTIVLTEGFHLRWPNIDVGRCDLQKIPYLLRSHKVNPAFKIIRRLFKTVLWKIFVGESKNTTHEAGAETDR
jgi:hypothetical protein